VTLSICRSLRKPFSPRSRSPRLLLTGPFCSIQALSTDRQGRFLGRGVYFEFAKNNRRNNNQNEVRVS
jgi:hypothetical protein